jgi:tetratricopeptide (TPR) repeat protein
MEVEMSKYDFWDELGRIFNAVVAYQEKTVEFNDRFITPWIKLGNVFDKQDRNKEAVSAYQKAIAIDPSNAKNWYELGNIYFQMNDFENAVDAYTRSTQLAPDSGWAYNNLALTFVSQGKYKESISLYQQSIDLLQVDKDKAVAWNRLGNVYRKLNNYEQAVRAFTEADKLDSENAGFRDELDDVTDGPTITETADHEGQDGSEVVDPIRMVLESSQELDVTSQVISNDFELSIETKIVEEQIVLEVGNESELTLEAASTTQAEAAPERISESAPDNLSADEIPLAISNVTPDADAPQEVEVDNLDSESVEDGDAFASEINVNFDDFAQPGPAVLAEETPVVKPRTVLEIVEAVIAKVLAESASEDESVESESVPEENPNLTTLTDEAEVVEEQNETDQTVLVAVDEVVSASSFEVVAETIGETVEVTISEMQSDNELETELLEEVSVTIEDLVLETDQNETLHLISQNISETFTESILIANIGTDTSDTSLLVAESEDELSREVQVEDAPLELPVAEQPAHANLAYEEYLKDNDGHFKIFGHESPKENEADAETLLPTELMAKIDFAGDIQIEADAKNAHVWNELGNVYFNSGAYEDAVIAYSKSIELDRQFAWPYSNLALVYVQKGRFAEAMLLYQRSIELFSNDKDKAISWNRLGNVYRRVSDYDNAISAYQRADELDTDNATLSLQSRFSLLGNYSMEKKPSYAA